MKDASEGSFALGCLAAVGIVFGAIYVASASNNGTVVLLTLFTGIAGLIVFSIIERRRGRRKFARGLLFGPLVLLCLGLLLFGVSAPILTNRWRTKRNLGRSWIVENGQ